MKWTIIILIGKAVLNEESRLSLLVVVLTFTHGLDLVRRYRTGRLQ